MDSLNRRLARLAALAATATVALFALASPANAADCSPELFDPNGHSWDLNSDGTISDGTEDAYDTYGYLRVEPDGGAETSYSVSDSTACTYEDGDREVVYTTETTAGFGGLAVSRKVYVPASGLSFARTLDIIHNPTGAAITATIRREGNLGTDGDTEIVRTSSGDDVVTTADSWAVIHEDDFEDTLPNIFWDSDAPGVADRADEILGPFDTEDDAEIAWQNVTVGPGETLIYMHIDQQDTSRENAIDFATANGGGAPDFYVGLSDSEKAALRNWPANGDQDRDGVQNPSDNCINTPNPDQADFDADGLGDACEADIDGDGLSNTTEEEIGSNPRNPDTDADGTGDKSDACPTRAGTGPDGCPVLAAAAGAPIDNAGPKAGLSVADDSVSLAQLSRGIPVTLTCDEACQANVRALGRMPTGAAFFSRGGFNRVLGRRILPYEAGTRTVTVRPCERRPGGAQSRSCLARVRKAGSRRRSFLVKIFVITNDRSGNRTETSKHVRVRR